MSAERVRGELMEEVESEEVELHLVDLGDAVVETKQYGLGDFTDCAFVPRAWCF